MIRKQDTVEYDNKMHVDLVKVLASDKAVVDAARVSTLGEDTPTTEISSTRDKGLINFLMKHGHTSPFEHGLFTFFIRVPLFVRGEVRTHRTFSFNEESGRYRQLSPLFYLPPDGRPLKQVGKIGSYTFSPGEPHQYELLDDSIENVCGLAYRSYEEMLNRGVAKEVARMVLPMNTYTSLYVTADPHNLMHFLDLRTDDEAMYEMREVANKMEAHFKEAMPVTWQAWKDHRGKSRSS